MASIELTDEILQAAFDFARTHAAYEGGDRSRMTAIAHDLAAHALATAVAEPVLLAQAGERLEAEEAAPPTLRSPC
jgi:hypothetical protein